MKAPFSHRVRFFLQHGRWPTRESNRREVPVTHNYGRPTLTSCHACGAAIRWLVTVRGKRVPIDPEPSPDGNIVIEGNGRARVIGSTPKPKDGELYRSHFATCPMFGRPR